MDETFNEALNAIMNKPFSWKLRYGSFLFLCVTVIVLFFALTIKIPHVVKEHIILKKVANIDTVRNGESNRGGKQVLLAECKDNSGQLNFVKPGSALRLFLDDHAKYISGTIGFLVTKTNYNYDISFSIVQGQNDYILDMSLLKTGAKYPVDITTDGETMWQRIKNGFQ
ncbi:MAG: hypothetical protein ABI113_19240 [Mucilaginibacter sp.]